MFFHTGCSVKQSVTTIHSKSAASKDEIGKSRNVKVVCVSLFSSKQTNKIRTGI